MIYSRSCLSSSFLAGLGAFTTIHNKQFSDNNFGPHAVLGSVLVVVALLIAVLAAIGRWSGTATRLSAALLGLMVLQFVLGVAGANSAPVLGGLHAVNAVLIVAVVYLLMKDASRAQRRDGVAIAGDADSLRPARAGNRPEGDGHP